VCIYRILRIASFINANDIFPPIHLLAFSLDNYWGFQGIVEIDILREIFFDKSLDRLLIYILNIE